MSSLTRYFPGGAATEVTERNIGLPGLAMPSVGPSASGVSGFPDFSGILRERQRIEAEREARAAAMQRLQMRAMQAGMARDGRDERRMEGERFNAGLANQSDQRFRGNVQDLQLQAMQAENAAASAPPPMRLVSGAGYSPGYVQDTNAMNSYQRRMFLPNDSRMNASGAADDSARQQRNDDDFAAHNERVRRNRALESQGGY